MVEFKSTRVAFGEALLSGVESGSDIVAVTADTATSMGLDLLNEKYPERIFNAGIAEQSMMMMAAGMASTGKIAFAVSYSVFTSMRVLEQLRTFICYPDLNVKVVGGLGGFSAGIEGVTHMALEDLGIIRCIPNITIINPADYYATKKAVRIIIDTHSPCYLRVGREPTECIFDENYNFKLGKANILSDTGNEVAIFTTGIITVQVVKVIEELKKYGIGIKLVEIHTLKPIDEKTIIDVSDKVKHIFTIEEHNPIGGLYSAICEILSSHKPKRVNRISAPYEFTQSGLPDKLLDYYDLSKNKIVNIILSYLKKHKN